MGLAALKLCPQATEVKLFAFSRLLGETRAPSPVGDFESLDDGLAGDSDGQSEGDDAEGSVEDGERLGAWRDRY